MLQPTLTDICEGVTFMAWSEESTFIYPLGNQYSPIKLTFSVAMHTEVCRSLLLKNV